MQERKTYKKGFTMAELLVCLAIISVIATILIPTVGRIRPDKEKTMFKKAYSLTERVVEELVNDPELYPDNGINVGFDNGGAVRYNGVTYGNGSVTLAEENYQSELNEACPSEGEDAVEDVNACKERKAAELNDAVAARIKFCQLFAMKLNTLENSQDITINCIEASYADQNMNAGAEGFVQWTHNTNNGFLNNGINSFTTTDGMIWRMPYTNFTAVNNEGVAIPTIADIWVDVNGEKGPNLVDADLRETPNATCDPDDDPDTFFITVRADGKIEVNGACAREYVSDMTLMHKR